MSERTVERLIVAALDRSWHSHWAFVAIPVAIYGSLSLLSHLNIGHRHLLPLYPFLYLACGVLGAEWAAWRGPRQRRWTAALSLSAIAVSSSFVFTPPWDPTRVYPHYLAYFNEFAGGPRHGFDHLVDSNLDWGQGLKALAAYLERRSSGERQAQPINLCYFGTADLAYYGISYVRMPCFDPLGRREASFHDADDGTTSITGAAVPGLLVISATHLQGAYFGKQRREQWRRLLQHARLVDTIGHSLFVFSLGQ